MMMMIRCLMALGLISIVSLSAVSADTWTVYHENHKPVKNNAEIAGSSEMTGVQQLTNAIAQAAGDSTIVIKPGVYDLGAELTAENTKDTLGKSYLTIPNKKLFLKGENTTPWNQKTSEQETVLKGGSGGRILYAYAGSGRSSVYCHLTFEGGHAESGKDGGAIRHSGTENAIPFKQAYASNCVFRGNSAASGGAIIHLHAYDCQFVGNTATSVGGAAYGDAVNGDYKYTNDFIRCTFEGNSATGNGGALYMLRAGRVQDCLFITNKTTTGSGGALYAYHPAFANACLTNCTFSGNSATGTSLDGGAVYLNMTRLSIMDCVFTNNTTTGSGGAIMSSSSAGLTLLADCTFVDNSAAGAGAVRSDANIDVMTNCVFIGNRVTSRAGAVRLSSTGLVTHCRFCDNTASDNAGALLADAKKPIVTQCFFTNNVTENVGGAIWYKEGFDTLDGCTFVSNRAVAAGGVYSEAAVASVSNCVFISNGATGSGTSGNGGALSVPSFDLMTHCTFRDNYAANMVGGLIVSKGSYGYAGDGVVRLCEFDNNTNKWNACEGSQIRYAKKAIDCRFSGFGDFRVGAYDRCVFGGCRYDLYDSYGSAFMDFVGGTPVGAYVRNCLFTNNVVHIYIRNSMGRVLPIENCTFVDNDVVTCTNQSNKTQMNQGYLIYAFRGGTDPDHAGMNLPSTNDVINCVFYNNRRQSEAFVFSRNDLNFYGTGTSVATPAGNRLYNSSYGPSSFGTNPAVQENNISTGAADPGFVRDDTKHGEAPYYSLLRKSRLRNAGKVLDWMDAEATDLVGNPRIVGTTPDMGCYECVLQPLGFMMLVR